MRGRLLFLLHVVLLLSFQYEAKAENDIAELFSRGLEEETEGDCTSAIFIFQDVLAENRYFIDAKIALARCYYKIGNFRESEILLKEAIHQERRNTQARNLLGNVLIALQRYDEAEEAFRGALEIEPANIETQYGLADLYRAKGDHQSAVQIYDRLLKVYPQEVWTYIYMGTSYTEMKDLERAGGFFRKAVSLDSHSSWTHVNLGRYYYRMGVKYSGAYFDASRPDASGSDKSREFFDAAVYEAQIALGIEPGLPEAYSILSSVYFFQKKYAEAEDALMKLLRFGGEDHLRLYSLAYCHEMLGNFREAERYYAKALSKRIDDEITRFRLENVVLSLYRRSLSEEKRHELAEFHHSKARFYLDKNIMNKAFLQYKRAVQLDPLDPRKRLELAELFKIRRFHEMYLYELKEIVRDTLDIDTVDINDRIEIYENRISHNLAARWRVKQYGGDEEDAGYFPRTKSTVVVYDAFFSDYIYENFLHPRLSRSFSQMMSAVVSTYPKIETVDTEGELLTRQEALKKARDLNIDYYLTGALEEKEDSIKARINLHSGFNGKVLRIFETYFTGNDKVFHAVTSLAEDINQTMPLRGLIVRMEGERALINLGRAHGVDKDMKFHIFREGGLRKSPETGELVVDTDVSLGMLTITEVDEMIAEGEYSFSGIYNRVNIYDNVLLIEEEGEPEEKE
jgi:tetratricopeptide (TPR) repeat protein